jgi:hypothetical protein
MNFALARTFMRSPFRLDRAAYLATLAVLQVALMIDVAPRLAAALAPHAYLAFNPAWLSVAQAAGFALALAGSALVLAFPVLALARHAQRGRMRFLGLPRFGARLAIVGAIAFAAAKGLAWVAHSSLAIVDASVSEIAASLSSGGIALMAAGALTAEVLRRGIAPMRVPIAPWHCRPVRIEVIDPPELATRTG